MKNVLTKLLQKSNGAVFAPSVFVMYTKTVICLAIYIHFISPNCGGERKYRHTDRYILHIQIYKYTNIYEHTNT